MKLILILSLLLNVFAAGYRDEYEDIGDPCHGEEIHWSVKPYNPYEDTIIITNPYE